MKATVGGQFSTKIDKLVTGGRGIGRAPDGRTTFVSGVLPNEKVNVEVTAIHNRRLEAKLVNIEARSERRQSPPCEYVTDGCGGCDWQHITPDQQTTQRVAIVEDCLSRLSGIDNVAVTAGPSLPTERYRTTIRAGVADGSLAYRGRRSHALVPVDDCLVAHPLVQDIVSHGYFGRADSVTIRVGANTGERMVIVSPTAANVTVADDVIVVGADELAAGRNPYYHEELGGMRLQISAESFFQCRPDGALLLAQLAGDAVAEGEGTLLDAYCGMGLFATLAGIGRRCIGVESNPVAVGNARQNAGPHATIVQSKFECWKPTPVGVVIADPARAGLKRTGVDKIVATAASHVALVSCDPGSMARDAALFVDHGYSLDQVIVVDLFGQTSHIETVCRFVKT